MSNGNEFEFIFSCEGCEILVLFVNSISEMHNERND